MMNVNQSRLNEKVGLDLLGIRGTNGARRFEGGWPEFTLAGFSTIGIPNNFMPESQDDPQYQYVANGNWTKGSHNVRFGFDLYTQAINHVQPQALSGAPFGASGGFAFGQGQTRLKGGAAGSEYNAFASFLLGATNQLGRTSMIPDVLQTRNIEYSGYLGDRWQPTRKLTLNYGVRWEYIPIATRPNRGIEQYNWSNNTTLLCDLGSVPSNCGISESKHDFVPGFGSLTGRAIRSSFVRGMGSPPIPTPC